VFSTTRNWSDSFGSSRDAGSSEPSTAGTASSSSFEESVKDGNLVTLFTDAGRRTGLVAFGFVTDAEAYVADWHRSREEAA
jgi:hypothetical protein